MTWRYLKQRGTGNYVTTPEIPENEIFDLWYFDTVSKTVQQTTIVGGSEFEMALNQLVFTDRFTGDQWFYNGPDVDPPSVTFLPDNIPPLGPPTYSLILQASPSSGGTVANLTGGAPYEVGDTVNIQATANTGWNFVNWTRNGDIISENNFFTYTIPAASSILVANFEQETPPEPEPEEIETFIADNAYPLEIRIRGVQISLPNITQRLVTNLFSADFEGEYSFPVSITLSEKIRLALKLPDDPASKGDFSNDIPAELWGHGNRLYRGFLNILTGQENTIRAVFVFQSGFFIEQNKTKKLAECYEEDDIIELDRPSVAVGGHEIRFSYTDVRLSVNGIVRIWFKAEFETHIEMLEAMADYLEGLGFNLQVTIQYSDDLEDELSKIIAWDTTTPTTMTLQPTDANSRFTRARRLTSRRFDMGAYNESDEANRIAFPQFYNRNLYDDSNPIFDGIVNRYDELGRLYYSNISYQTFSESFLWANTLIPMIYLTDIVRTVFEHLKIEVTGEFFESDLVKKILVYNNRTLDYVQVSENGVETRRTGLRVHMGDAEPDQIIYRYENVHDFNIRLRNHVPDMSITEFLKGLKNWLNLRYDFNILQNKVEIRFVRSIYRAPEILDLSKHAGRVYEIEYGKENGIGFTYANPDPIMQDGNIGELPTPQYTVNNYMAMLVLDAEIDEICFVRSLKAYFRLTPNNEEEPSWKIRAFVQQDDDTEKRVAWECGAVPMVDGYFNNRKMPSIEMTAWQPEINLFNRETGLRLTAFYGAQPDSNDYPYAFASSTRYNAKELATPDQYDLDLRGPDIYPYWRYTESTLKGGKLLGCTLKLNESMLRRLSSTSKIRIVNIDYLIKENEVTNTFEEFALAKAKLYKIKI